MRLQSTAKITTCLGLRIFYTRGVKKLSEHNPFFPRLDFGQNENLELLNDCLKGLAEVSGDIDDIELEAEVMYHTALNCLLSPFRRSDAAAFFTKAAAAYSQIDNSDRGISFIHPREIQSLALEGLALALCGNYEASRLNSETALKFIASNPHLQQACPPLKVMSLITKMEILYFFFKNPELLPIKSDSLTMKIVRIASIQPAEIIQVINEAREAINEICEHQNPQKIDKDSDYSLVFFENDARINYIKQDIEALA